MFLLVVSVGGVKLMFRLLILVDSVFVFELVVM